MKLSEGLAMNLERETMCAMWEQVQCDYYLDQQELADQKWFDTHVPPYEVLIQERFDLPGIEAELFMLQAEHDHRDQSAWGAEGRPW